MSMADYKRDYGKINGGGGNSSPTFSPTRKTQTFQATHKGTDYLPFMNRSFISFSFGGKNIEDYGLIATFNDSRMNRQGYASFEDLITNYNVLDGQLYWGTHFKGNQLSFTLSTDGITQNQLDDFKLWFTPGKNRELILAEHPNRAIIARVGEPPKLELLPFEEPTSILIGGYEYKTSTTLYKGDIELSFVMDSPFWYSKINIFGYGDNKGVYHDVWTNANGKQVQILDDPDALKVALEDGIPISSMLAVSLLLGDNTFANMDDEQNGIIAMEKADITLSRDNTDHSVTLNVVLSDTQVEEGSVTLYNTESNVISDPFKWRAIAFTQNTSYAISKTDNANTIYTKLYNYSTEQATTEPYTILKQNVKDVNWRSRIAQLNNQTNEYVSGAKIAGPIMNQTTGIAKLQEGDISYFYYAGTAPSFPILKFKMQINMSSYYINSPQNSYTSSVPYNTLTIESTTKQEFKFTTPNIYTSYNQVISIFNETVRDSSWESVREKIRTNVNHSLVRQWAMRVIDSQDTDGSGIVKTGSAELKIRMSYMFKKKTDPFDLLTATFTFNSQTGEAVGEIQCRKPSSTRPSAISNWGTEGTIVTLTENVGDMVRSNFLIIRDRNYPDENGFIRAREKGHEETYKYCHILYHNVADGLENVFIQYQNMYL